ncbi:MAG TPA: TolC family protein [Cyclobacteriaceae bacterium]|nr:TolC family protein [Cyclobacteriaceae bacterium]
MRKIIILVLIVSTKGVAQDLALPDNRQSIEILLSNESAIDSLVNLAITNSYAINGYKAELLQQHENVRQERTRWLSTFRLGINFFSMTTSVNSLDQSITRVGVLPNLGFNLTVDPEKFINRSSYIREAQQNVVRAENQVSNQRKMLRTEIVGLFYTYLESLGILELRTSASQNMAEQCLLIEEKFKKGEGRMEDLLNSQNALVLARESLLKAQLNVRRLRKEINILISDSEAYFTERPMH